LAGHESTASALASHLYYLATHPDVQTKAREEVLSVLDSDDAIQHNTKLPYLEAVIYESLRIHPPTDALPFRAIAHDVQLEGKSGKMHTLPKGSLASLSLTALHNNPDIWMNPHEFRPERFLNQDERESTKHAFMPFGTGPRMCIGMNFSLLEQRIVLSMLLRCFEWTLPADSPHKDGIQSTGFTLLKANPMHLSFTRRP
jgi:cytochrome P450